MQIRHGIAVAALVLLAVCATGCVHVRNAIHNTIGDATDLIGLDFSGSFGTDMGAHVMVTKFVQLKSYSYEDLYRVGLGARHIGIWEEAREDWWVGPRHSRHLHVNRKPIISKMAYYPFARTGAGTEPPYCFLTESRDEIGVGFHFLVGGLRLGVRPLEFLDLLANLVGLDPCNDNATWPERCAWIERRKAQKDRAAASKPAPGTPVEPANP